MKTSKTDDELDDGSSPLGGVPSVLPSVDDVCPLDQGGPIARIGFTYQDEVAVGFVIEMIRNPALLRVHCETHDDMLLVWATEDGNAAEYVQVKAGEPDQLWTVAGLCRRDGGKAGCSIYEHSLNRDAHQEFSLFRIVSLRPVSSDLSFLTYARGAPGRECNNPHVLEIKGEIEHRCPGAKSLKGNGAAFWLEQCRWEVCHDRAALVRANVLALLRLASREERLLLPEQADILLEELRLRVKIAGDARWEPDRAKKILHREDLREWWEWRTEELRSGAGSSAGGKLADKLRDAGVEDETIALALDLRRDYAAAVRTSHYMDDNDGIRLQGRVKSELMTLRARYAAGQIVADGVGFHALCLNRLEAINQDRPLGSDDRAAFLQGCMYDIADRCLHRFARPTS